VGYFSFLFLNFEADAFLLHQLLLVLVEALFAAVVEIGARMSLRQSMLATELCLAETAVSNTDGWLSLAVGICTFVSSF